MSDEEIESSSEETNFNEKEYIEQLFDLDEEESENAEETVEDDQEPEVEETNQDEKKTEKGTKFPLARIKTLMKMDPDLNLVSQESVFLIARASEIFLGQLAQSSYLFTAKSKRKTLLKRDVDAAIDSTDSLCFLEGALD